MKRYNAKSEEKLISSSNLGTFYRFISSKLNSVTSAAPLVNSISDIIVFTGVEKANLLNEHFASVFASDNGLDVDKVYSCFRDSIDLSELTVQKALCKVKSIASAGRDWFSACFS